MGKNELLIDIKKVYWISKIELSKHREENNIRDCFVDQTVIFYYLNNVEDFNDFLEIYTLWPC